MTKTTGKPAQIRQASEAEDIPLLLKAGLHPTGNILKIIISMT
jgi:hypothetical protein